MEEPVEFEMRAIGSYLELAKILKQSMRADAVVITIVNGPFGSSSASSIDDAYKHAMPLILRKLADLMDAKNASKNN